MSRCRVHHDDGRTSSKGYFLGLLPDGNGGYMAVVRLDSHGLALETFHLSRVVLMAGDL